MTSLCIIPARYSSERLPGKPLLSLGKTSLIETVWQKVYGANVFTEVYVATDHPKIADHVREFGGKVLMTSPDCQSGTERVLEVAAKLPEFDYYINVQGDEPLIPRTLLLEIREACKNLNSDHILTPVTNMEEDDIHNPNVVKVVHTVQGRALYFSRAPIPFSRKGHWVQELHMKHIGIYAFGKKALDQIRTLSSHPIERYEVLEQLRWLMNDLNIYVMPTNYRAIGVDTVEDLAEVRKIMNDPANEWR